MATVWTQDLTDGMSEPPALALVTIVAVNGVCAGGGLHFVADADIVSLEIPTGQPIVYELDGELRKLDRYYLSERS